MADPDIKLSSAIRNNLLSLQNTASMVATTQGRLATGMRVASAIDDASAYFQAKALTDRAGDITEKKIGDRSGDQFFSYCAYRNGVDRGYS